MLHDQIGKDYVQAMKARDMLKSSTLNFLRAQLKNIAIDKKVTLLEDADVITVIKKQAKQRQESIDQYRLGNRMDLVEKEEGELKILKSYLPQELDEAQLKGMVQEAMKETNAASMKDMGTVMKVLGVKAAGRADNKTLSELVKQAISQL